MLHELIVLGIGFQDNELPELLGCEQTIQSRDALRPFRVLELASLGDFFGYAKQRFLYDILVLRLRGEAHEDSEIVQLGSLTQHHVVARLPLLMVTDGLDWVDIAYQLGALAMVAVPVETERCVRSLALIIEAAIARRKEILVLQDGDITRACPLRNVCWFQVKAHRAIVQFQDAEHMEGDIIAEIGTEKFGNFVAINASTWINLERVRYVRAHSVAFDGEGRVEVRIARNRAKMVHESCRLFWRYGRDRWREYLDEVSVARSNL